MNISINILLILKVLKGSFLRIFLQKKNNNNNNNELLNE